MKNHTARKKILFRAALLALSLEPGAVMHAMGYISGSSAMMSHNLGLFILVFSLFDDQMNLGEHIFRSFVLIVVWGMHHVHDLSSLRFTLSLVILVAILVLIWVKRDLIIPRFRLRLLLSVTIAFDFWFTLPAHSASMTMTPAIETEAVLMFFLMKLSTIYQQNAGMHNELIAHLANYDELTSAKNFTAYQKDVFNYFGTAHTTHQPLAIALLDIDHFKLVNDEYRHLAGNQILTEVAERLRNVLSQYSESYQLYRTGGEELTIIFPNSTVDEVLQILIHCWREIRSTDFVYDKRNIHVTISAGLSELALTDKSPDDLHKRVDESLYTSKRHGRDVITVNGATQDSRDDAVKANLAYFVKGVYPVSNNLERRRVANELVLESYDASKQEWHCSGHVHLDIDTRIEMMRETLINSHYQAIVVDLSVAGLLDQSVANELVKFFNSPDGPDTLYVQLKRVPALEILIPMAEFYHQHNIKIVLTQVGTNRHFDRINESLKYMDGIKLKIQSAEEVEENAITFKTTNEESYEVLQKDIQFWGKMADTWHVEFILDGVESEAMNEWLQTQTYIDYLEGSYFGKPTLPLLKA